MVFTPPKSKNIVSACLFGNGHLAFHVHEKAPKVTLGGIIVV